MKCKSEEKACLPESRVRTEGKHTQVSRFQLRFPQILVMSLTCLGAMFKEIFKEHRSNTCLEGLAAAGTGSVFKPRTETFTQHCNRRAHGSGVVPVPSARPFPFGWVPAGAASTEPEGPRGAPREGHTAERLRSAAERCRLAGARAATRGRAAPGAPRGRAAAAPRAHPALPAPPPPAPAHVRPGRR